MTAPVQGETRRTRLTDREVQSLRKMIGWREDWMGRARPRAERAPEVQERETRMRAWFAAEGIDPLQPLPKGVRPRAMEALGIESVEAFAWSLRNIRDRTERADRRAGRPRDPVVVKRIEAIEAYFAAAGIDPLRALPHGARRDCAAALGITYVQVQHAMTRIRGAR
ncbi:hypothetical protein [Tsukamurella paurometabola]|uniref:Uncharacterized protein n=1 Tax=Tsukamurella paurometabola TaxID=2061 RepID=A0A3P8MAQ7_TSUPA|nr:hypothetical protein [Tsukamurella paurometabola]UEA84441.1 hypothetical protein LK411_06355 [Tsukamurella paurometabola]VDR37006.1 Uncharacterised protein [Tsukamurella paurometabola]